MTAGLRIVSIAQPAYFTENNTWHEKVVMTCLVRSGTFRPLNGEGLGVSFNSVYMIFHSHYTVFG
jgi:hypothetical protein